MAPKIGIQLYSVKNAIRERPYEVLRQISEAGYRYVEAANHRAEEDPGVGFGMPARELKGLLDELGLQIVGCHVNPLREELLPAVLDYHAELGSTQIGCDIEFYPHGDLDYLKRRCQFFNRIGELCQERGMRYYYHNHYQEFQKFQDKYVLYHIVENTDPAYVDFELDTFWAMRGGADPLEVIRNLGGRMKLVHQKDFSKTTDSPVNLWTVKDPQKPIASFEDFGGGFDPKDFCEVGTGTMPIQDILDAANAVGADFVILEQDFTQLSPLESVKLSMESFRKYNGIEWE